MSTTNRNEPVNLLRHVFPIFRIYSIEIECELSVKDDLSELEKNKIIYANLEIS